MGPGTTVPLEMPITTTIGIRARFDVISISSQYICKSKIKTTKQEILLEQKASPAIVVSKIIVHPMTDRCSSFVQALCKYIYIILWWQGEIHITFLQLVILALKSWPLHQKYSRKGRDLYSWIHICLWEYTSLSADINRPFRQVHKIKMNTKSVLSVIWNLWPELWQCVMWCLEGYEWQKGFFVNTLEDSQQQRAFPWPMLLVWPDPIKKKKEQLNKWKLHKVELKCGL